MRITKVLPLLGASNNKGGKSRPWRFLTSDAKNNAAGLSTAYG
ncbi:MAG: hypothetical protein U1F42_07140 [Candidatus Competibacteraceae bacterium]